MVFDIKRLDIYRKVPKDLTQPTLTGAVISISCVFVICVLFLSELSGFLRVEIISSVYVDNPKTSSDDTDLDRIPVSITIELENLKCEYLGVDIQDDLGRHEVGFVDATEKTPVNGDKGCLFHSKFQINKVPGNFHISTHSSRSQPANPDFSHKIKEVRFGNRIINEDVPGSFNPLENVGKIVKDEDNHMGPSSHDYIMKIVPTVYEDGKKSNKIVSYQYTYAYRSFTGRGAAIWFRYDVSPLTVKYTAKSSNIYHFVTLLCAIIGGVFTVATMLDGILFSMTEYYKKFEMNKLS